MLGPHQVAAPLAEVNTPPAPEESTAESAAPRSGSAEAVPSPPAVDLAAPEPEPVQEDTSEMMPLRKVLIVEDTTELAEVIAYSLEEKNIISFRETHGEKALAVYETQQPDIVLLDIGLPDMTGWKLLDAIKARRDGPFPPVIVITAHSDPANRLIGKMQGVHDYLVKPFTPDEVERVVSAALDFAATKGAIVATADETNAADIPMKDTAEIDPGDLPEFFTKVVQVVEAESDEEAARIVSSAAGEDDNSAEGTPGSNNASGE